ncbi:MAG: hypothetical protein U1E67_05610 [Hyphomicrobiales bacterium]
MRSKHAPKFEKIVGFLCRIPAVEHNDTPSLGIASGDHRSGGWSVTFSLDIDHQLAWHVVQALGFVLNDLSLSERLPTVSNLCRHPHDMNGGPKEYLSWVIRDVITATHCRISLPNGSKADCRSPWTTKHCGSR